MNNKSVVYICAHQDDIISVAGTLTLLRKKGYQIYDFCLTRGQKGGSEPNIAEIRSAEEQKACEIIGAELRFYDQMDGDLYADQAICERVARDLEEVNPEAVITLWPLEKPDHSAAFSIAQKAMHLAGIKWTCDFYMSQVDTHGYNFRPELYVNITEVMDEVNAVIGCYDPKHVQGYLDYQRSLKKHNGMAGWCEAAEGFMTSLPMINKRWDRECEVGRLLRTL